MELTDTARDPEWVLTIGSPQSRWSVGDAIVVEAELRYIGPAEGTEYFGSGSGPLAFGLEEVGGTRKVYGASTLDCARHEIRPDTPLVVPYAKSGGFSGEDPNAAFYTEFLEDPLLHLPHGQWVVGVNASLSMPPDCGEGRSVDLRASITLSVE
jgi:hypothetical protein